MTGFRKAAPLGVVSLLALALGGCDGGGVDSPDGGMALDGNTPAPDGGSIDGSSTDGGPLDGGEVHEGEVTAGRLLIGDSTSTTVRVVDLDDATMAWSITAEAAGRLYGHPLSRYAYLANGDEVEIFSSGITVESHGDHYHVDKSDPALLTAHFHDATATAFAVFGEGNGRYAAAFNAVEGENSTVTLLQERTVSAGTPAFVEVDLGAAFEGMAIAAFGHLVVTHPAGNGVTLRELATPDDVEQAYDTQCPALAGMAGNEHGVFFGCANGLMVLEYHDDHFDLERIEYPAGTPEGTRITALRASRGTELLAATFGSNLAIVDVEADSFRVIDLPAGVSVLDFEIDMAGEHLLALTSDRNLWRFSMATGAAEGSPIRVLDADAALAPDLAVGPADAYIADPSAGHVVVVDIEGWTEEGHLEVGGSPASLVVVTVSPDFHAHAGHDH